MGQHVIHSNILGHRTFFCSIGTKGEPGLTIAEKGLPGPRGQDGEPGLSGAQGTQLLFLHEKIIVHEVYCWLV